MSGAVPQLRFPGFEGDWARSKVGAVGKVITGSTPDTAVPYYFDGEFPFYTPGDIPEVPRQINEASRSLTALGLAKVRPIPNGSSVFVCIGSTIGKVGFVQRAGAANQQINAVLPNEVVDPYFVFCSLQKISDFIRNLTSVQAVPIVNKKVFSEQVINVPSLPEQQKIADFLGTVDATLDALRRKKSGLEAFKSGLMQRLFSQELRFTQNDGTEFPDWEEEAFGNLIDWQSTNSLSREFLTDEPGDFQNIHYGDIHGKFPALFRQSEAEAPYVAGEAPIRAPKKSDFCRPGDVVFADASEDYADIGKAIEIIEVEEDSLLSGLHTHLARPKDRRLAVGFTGYMVRAETVRRQIMRFAQGISVLGISKDNLGKVRVKVPHPDEQRKIADSLSALDDKIAAVAGQITHMETFKKGLLQQMFV